jgi:hypothetical protein
MANKPSEQGLNHMSKYVKVIQIESLTDMNLIATLLLGHRKYISL